MTSDKTATRRRYSPEFKAQVMGECDVPGASEAKVAMSHGINTNVVHGWRKLAREGGGPTSITALAVRRWRDSSTSSAPQVRITRTARSCETTARATTLGSSWA